MVAKMKIEGISDLSAHIACELCNRWMLDPRILGQDDDYEDYPESEVRLLLAKQAAIVIDQAMKEFGDKVIKENQ